MIPLNVLSGLTGRAWAELAGRIPGTYRLLFGRAPGARRQRLSPPRAPVFAGSLLAKLRQSQSLGLQADDQLIAEIVPGGLLLRPAVTLPVEMYTRERVAEFDAAEAELAGVITGKRRRAT